MAKKVKCISVRLASLDLISPLAYKATAYDGSSDIIPASVVHGRDFEVTKSDAFWIEAWIMPSKKIQYSDKKVKWMDR